MTDRGVSETLGFVLVFALVVGTIGVVYAAGISGLEGAQHEEKVRNVERAFDVLEDNLEKLHRSGAPSRATELNLYDGHLALGEPEHVTIEVENTSDPGDNATIPTVTRPIVYADDDRDSRVVYASGAVFRSDRGRAAMRSSPDWVVTDDYLLVPFVSTTGRGDADAIGGRGTVLVVAQTSSRRVKGSFVAGGGAEARVNVTVASPRAAAWGRYLEGLPHDGSPPDPDGSDGTVTYTFLVERVYVPETIVEVSFRA